MTYSITVYLIDSNLVYMVLVGMGGLVSIKIAASLLKLLPGA